MQIVPCGHIIYRWVTCLVVFTVSISAPVSGRGFSRQAALGATPTCTPTCPMTPTCSATGLPIPTRLIGFAKGGTGDSSLSPGQGAVADAA